MGIAIGQKGEKMGRLIYEEDAIKKIEKAMCEDGFRSSTGLIHKETVYEAIKSAPSAQPERERGKWIIKDNPGTGWYRVTCSECGEDVTSTAPCIGFYPNAKVIWNYCPDCGADMREVDDERPD